MNKRILFLILFLLAAGFAGTASAVLVTHSLEQYASSLLDDRRFAALAPSTHATSTTLEESLALVQETAANSLVFFIDERVSLAQGSPFLSEDDVVQGEGLVMSADGWILTTRDQLAKFAHGKDVYSGFAVMKDGERFVVEKVVLDTQTRAVAVRVSAAQGWVPSELAREDEVPAGGMVLGLESAQKVYTLSVSGRTLRDDDGIVPIEDVSSRWDIAGGDTYNSGLPLFTAQARLFGFVTSEGDAFSAQALRPFIKQVLRGSSIAHAALGVRVTDLSHTSSLDPEITRGYRDGVLVIAPAGERTGVVTGGPADGAGITDGDIILALDDVQITRTTTCADILASYAPGQQVSLRVDRSGEVKEIKVTLGTWEELIY